MADSSDIDNAVIAKLAADPELASYATNGVYRDEAPAGATAFVIVSLVEETDEDLFGGRGFEHGLYLVEYRELQPRAGVGKAKAAAARIDALLDPPSGPADLTLPGGYALSELRREGRSTPQVEVDEVDESIRWNRRGGYYRVRVTVEV